MCYQYNSDYYSWTVPYIFYRCPAVGTSLCYPHYTQRRRVSIYQGITGSSFGCLRKVMKYTNIWALYASHLSGNVSSVHYIWGLFSGTLDPPIIQVIVVFLKTSYISQPRNCVTHTCSGYVANSWHHITTLGNINDIMFIIMEMLSIF